MRYFLIFLTSVVLFFLFIILEYGHLSISFNEAIQPVILTLATILIFFQGKFRHNIFRISLIMLVLMVLFYFLNQFSVSNWIGSLGIGILTVLIISYFPEFTKNGHI